MTLENTSSASDTGPLTIDQAVDIQIARRETAAQPPAPKKSKAPPAEAVAPEVADVADDLPESEGVADMEDSEADTQAAEDVDSDPSEDNASDDDVDPPEPETAIEAPQFWDAEGKEHFAKLSKEAQKSVLAYEKQRIAVVAKAMQKSAETTKVFEARIAHLEGVAERAGAYIDQGEADVTAWNERMSEWDAWFVSDAAQELAEFNDAAYRKQEARFRQEQVQARQALAALEKSKTDKAEAEKASFSAYVDEQQRLIGTFVPELADGHKDVGENRKALYEYLVSTGEKPDAIRKISAYQAHLAWKARQFDQLGDISALRKDAEAYRRAKAVTASATSAPKPKPKAGPVTPSGGGRTSSSSEAAMKALESKKNWSAEDHVRYQTLKAKIRK